MSGVLLVICADDYSRGAASDHAMMSARYWCFVFCAVAAVTVSDSRMVSDVAGAVDLTVCKYRFPEGVCGNRRHRAIALEAET